MNISDLDADLEFDSRPDREIVHARSRLVDKDQKEPPAGPIHCRLTYTFRKEEVVIRFHYDAPASVYEGPVEIIFPVIASSDEAAGLIGDKTLRIARPDATINISCDQELSILPTTTKNRLFNFVPGLQAIPLLIRNNDAVISIRVQ